MTEEWTATECADEWGIKLRTWHSYVARDQAPKPSRRIGRTPIWDAETVRAYPRPGRGARTDLTSIKETAVPESCDYEFEILTNGGYEDDPRWNHELECFRDYAQRSNRAAALEKARQLLTEYPGVHAVKVLESVITGHSNDFGRTEEASEAYVLVAEITHPA